MYYTASLELGCLSGILEHHRFIRYILHSIIGVGLFIKDTRTLHIDSSVYTIVINMMDSHCLLLNLYIYIYIYREREREKMFTIEIKHQNVLLQCKTNISKLVNITVLVHKLTVLQPSNLKISILKFAGYEKLREIQPCPAL